MSMSRMLLMSWIGFAVLFFGFGCDDSAGLPADGDVSEAPPYCDCVNGCNPDGSCILSECADDADCPSGQFCIDGECKLPTIDPGDEDLAGDVDGDKIDGDIQPDGDTPNINPNDPDGLLDGITDIDFDTDVPHLESNPWIMVDPLSLDFGAVPQLSQRQKTVTVVNIGAADLLIDAVYLYYDQNDVVPELEAQTDTLPIRLAKDEQTEITVNYTARDLDADQDVLIIRSNDPSQPNVGVPIKTDVKSIPELYAEPQRIDFGVVRLGDHTQSLLLKNLGGVTITVLDMYMDPETAEFFVTDTPDSNQAVGLFDVEPADEITVSVHYSPEAADGVEDAATLVIQSNAERNTILQVPLTGTACEPVIVADPEEIDFTDVAFGGTTSRCTLIQNDGCWDLGILSIEMTDDGGGAYSFTHEPVAPTEIGDEEEQEVCVTYSPVANSDNTGEILITSNDPEQPELTVALLGNELLNTCPVAVIGVTSPPIDQIRQGDTVQLDGTGSYDDDPGDGISEYIWSIESQPSGSQAALSDPSSAQPTISLDEIGAYVIKLEVVDNYGELSCIRDLITLDAADPTQWSGDPAAIGHFVDVLTGDTLSGLYWEMQDNGQTIGTSVTSNSAGEAALNGSYPVRSYGAHVPDQPAMGDYTCPDMTVTLIEQATAHVTFSCQPQLPQGALRIVLHWDNWTLGGADLDAHLYMPGNGHVYYSNRTVGDAQLDHDGGIQAFNPEPSPETITINSLVAGTYCYSIYDFSRAGGPWRGVNARVEIFDANGLYASITGPSYGAGGGWWHVVRIDGSSGQISTINQLATSAPSCP